MVNKAITNSDIKKSRSTLWYGIAAIAFFLLSLFANWWMAQVSQDGLFKPWDPISGMTLPLGVSLNPIFSLIVFIARLSSEIFIYHTPITWLLIFRVIGITVSLTIIPRTIVKAIKLDLKLSSTKDLIIYMVIAVFSGLLIALIEFVYSRLAFIFSYEPAVDLILHYWFNQIIGMISISTVLLFCGNKIIANRKRNHLVESFVRSTVKKIRSIPARLLAEILSILFLIIGVLILVSVDPASTNVYYISFIPLIWIAIRFGRYAGAIGALIIFIGIFYSATSRYLGLNEILELQVYSIIMIPITLVSGSIITDQNNVNQELKSSENRFRSVAETAPVGICQMDMDGNAILVNKNWCKLTNSTENDLLGKPLPPIVHPDYRVDLAAKISSSLKSGQSFTINFPLKAKSEKLTWIKADFSILKVDKTIPKGLIATMTDITFIVEQEQEVRSNERLLSSFIDNLPDPAWLKDAHGRYLAINREMEKLHHINRADFVGKTDAEVWMNEYLDLFLQTDAKVLETRQPLRFESKLDPEDDSTWYETVKAPIILNDVVLGTTGIAREISDRHNTEIALRDSETRMKALLNNITDLAWLKDESGRFMAVNEIFCSVHGLTAEEVIGKRNQDLFPSELADIFDRDDLEVLTHGRPKVIEEPIKDESGRFTWFETIKMPIYNDSREIVGTTGIAREITSRKRADEATQLKLNTEKMLSNISSRLNRVSLDSYQSEMTEILGMLAEATHADRATFLSLTIGDTLEHTYQWCTAGVENRNMLWSFDHWKSYPWLKSQFTSGNSVQGTRATDFPPNAAKEMESWLSEGLVSLLFVPIKLSERKLGAIIGIETVEMEESWQADEIQIMRLLGEMFNATLARLANEKLVRVTEARYRLLIEQIQAVVYIDYMDELSSSEYFSPQIKQLTGYSAEEIISDASLFWRIIHPDDRDRVLQDNSRTNKTGEKFQCEYRIICRDNRIIWVEDRATMFIDAYGSARWHGVLFDITHRKEIEEALYTSQRRYHELFEHSPIALWEEDFSLVKKRLDHLKKHGTKDFREFLYANPKELHHLISLIKVLDVNRSTIELTKHHTKAELVSSFIGEREFIPDELFIEEMIHLANGEIRFEVEGANDLQDGNVRYHHVHVLVAPGYENTYERVIIAISDITDRRETDEKLIYLSTHDGLTGLFSRSYYETEMARLQDSRQYPITILMADVDRLKEVNDKEGHSAGDLLIKRAASVLKLAFRPEDVVARIGGDEFSVIIPKTDLESAEKLVARLRSSIDQDNSSTPEKTALGLSIGYATAQTGDLLVDVLKAADKMMYNDKNKRNGKPSRRKPRTSQYS